nr:hypothetical protein [Cytophagales bacterium]
MIRNSEKTMLVFDQGFLEEKLDLVNQKLDKILSSKDKSQNDIMVDWITSKAFMETVSIKAFSSFYNILDRIPEAMKKKVGGKIYVHRDTIRKYFEGAFTDQK